MSYIITGGGSGGGGGADTFVTDAGSAVEAGGVINIVGGQGLNTSGAGNTVTANIDNNVFTTAVHGWNGSLLESLQGGVTSDGATITLSIEKLGGGDLTVVFSDGFYDWDTTPADTVTLTAGTDTVPVLNFVFFLQSTKTLTANTTGFPAAEHAAIGRVLCQSAASLQTDGAYIEHAWADHVVSVFDQGHIPDLNKWIRLQPATWVSGVAPTLTITPNGGAADNVIFTSTEGVILHLHEHPFPAFTGTPDIYVINDFTTPFNKVTDLNEVLTDSTGASMSGNFFSLVIWGVGSANSPNAKLMCNVPGGSYNNQTNLEEDIQKFAEYDIPSDYTGTGFLIAQLNLRHQAAASGTWTEIEVIDLRGLAPSIAPGGSTSAAIEFDDSGFRIFDDADDTKKIAFEASGITTATTRTLTVQDSDGTLAYLSDISGGLTWNEETGTSVTMLVDNGYVSNNVGLVTLTLPDTAAFGSIVRVVGKGTGGWRIAQNASEIIHFLGLDTTTGVTGRLDSNNTFSGIELLCTVADTEWTVISATGNIDVT